MNDYIQTCPRQVPNRPPLIEPPGTARIAVVAQSPGDQESHFGAPLVGPSGELLRDALGQCGIAWNQLFLGNVSQVQPPRNDFSTFDWNGQEVRAGIAQLRADLAAFNPSIVLCLGNEALHLFKQGNVAPPRKGRQIDWPNKITSWRGSLFASDFLTTGVNGDQSAREEGEARLIARRLKCLAAYHPAAVLREFGLQGYYRTGLPGFGDFERLALEAGSRELDLPRREVVTRLDIEAVLEVLAHYRQDALPVALDIEGTPGNVTSIAFAACAEVADVIPLARADGSSVWSEEDEVVIWQAIKELLEDARVPKIAQHGQYDFFALAWTYGIGIRNWAGDTEEGSWELAAELKKSLASQTSLLTREPFYKPDREDGELKFASDDDFWRYNGMDAAVTFECWQRQQALMTAGQRAHYTFNMQIKPITLYETLRGIKVDKERVSEEQKKAQAGAWELQARIDEVAVAADSKLEALASVKIAASTCDEPAFALLVMRALCGKVPKREETLIEERWQPMRWNGKKWVKDGKLCGAETAIEIQQHGVLSESMRPVNACQRWLKPMPRTVTKLVVFVPTTLSELEDHILDSEKANWKIVKRLWKEIKGAGSCPPAQLGQLSIALGLAINASSTNEGGDAQRFLFDICGLPRIVKDERTGRLSTVLKGEAKSAGKKLCTDQNALDKLYAATQDERALWVLQQRRLKKVVTDLDKEIDDDGRIRCSFSLVKETGRMAASKSPTGTGTNLQAWNKDLRRVCVADDGFLMGQCDLEGADSWTVAAECAALGDLAMLNDLKAGLKPAKVLCLLYLFGAEVNHWDRDTIKARLKETKMDEWLYPGAKSSVHASCYGAGIPTLISNVLKFSMSDLPLDLGTAKPIVLTTDQARKLQDAFFSRYPGVKLWHAKEARNLLTHGYITTSAGHTRRFYGRKSVWKKGAKVVDHDTLKEALSSKPQFWTTFATKKALHRLWHDPENRRDDGSLKVEPLICVHDSLLAQWKCEDDAFARAKMKAWFDNEIEVAGIKLTIPADGTVGFDWSMKPSEKL